MILFRESIEDEAKQNLVKTVLKRKNINVYLGTLFIQLN